MSDNESYEPQHVNQPAEPSVAAPPTAAPDAASYTAPFAAPYAQPTTSMPSAWPTPEPTYAYPSPYGQQPYIPAQPPYAPGQQPYVPGQQPYIPGQPVSAMPGSALPMSGAPMPGTPAYGQYPAYGAPAAWAPPPPQRKRRTGLIVVSIVAVIAVLCGGLVAVGYVLNSDKGSGKTLATGPTASVAPLNGSSPSASAAPSAAPSTTAPVIPKGDGTALKGHIVPAPSGAQTIHVLGSTNGVMSLAQFVKVVFNNDSTEKSLLQDQGFEVAAEERWYTKTVETHVQLIQFQDEDGSANYGEGQNIAFGRDTKFTTTSLSGVTDGYEYHLKALDAQHEHRDILMAPAGPVYVVLFFYSTKTLNRTAELTLLKQQLAKLGS